MSMFLQIMLAIAAISVVFGVIWTVLTSLRTPIRAGRGTDVHTVIRVRDSAPELEQTLKGLIWLQENDMVLGQILIVDCGMDEEGLALTRIAAQKYKNLKLLAPEEVHTWITQKS